MTSVVLRENGTTLKESFEKIFRYFNFAPRGKIFIKPNFSGRPPLIPGENTDSQFLKELAEFLISRGADEIIVGHGALLGTIDKHFPFDEIIEGGGFSFLRKMPKVRLLDLDKEERELMEFNGIKFSITKILKTVDSYINLAKLKTHMETTVSLSIKNQMGLVSMGDRVMMHHTELEKTIAHLAKLAKPALSIVDGIIAMEGNGPHHGKGKKLDLIIAGDDVVELDSAICSLIGADFKKVRHISTAKEIGVGNYPSDEFLSSIEKYKISDFKLASQYEKFGNILAWPTTACSRCITAISESGKIMKKHPLKYFGLIRKIFLGKKRYNVVIGKAEDLNLPKNEKTICIGQCTKQFAEKQGLKCLDKCPPSIEETMEFIKQRIGE